MKQTFKSDKTNSLISKFQLFYRHNPIRINLIRQNIYISLNLMFKMTTDPLIMVIDKKSDLTGPISMPNRSKSECEL